MTACATSCLADGQAPQWLHIMQILLIQQGGRMARGAVRVPLITRSTWLASLVPRPFHQ